MHIREYQKLMHQLYFHKDSKRGAKGTFDRLVDEVAELGEALAGQDKETLEKEFADALAWLASLANVADVDLEKAAIDKYNGKCPKCGNSPCKCPFLV
ncbi:nucleotide pyrophosphohydrolase [Candidatus Bathyarchaeota archaeon]|nr:nucleotide pyrophosphohydrolase [Candidatus Bathyarchaeota archaeon]